MPTVGDPGLTSAAQADASTQDKLVAWVRSHWALRMTIGVVAILLPLLTIVIVALTENGLLTSISDSYHHRYANSVFIGSMCAFAAFLWAYDYKRNEDVWGNRAAVAAVGVAVFSTVPARLVLVTDHVVPPSLRPDVVVVAPGVLERVSGTLHFVSAAVFFVALARFCQIWAQDPDGDGHAGVYRRCSYLIYGGLVGAIVVEAGSRAAVAFMTPSPTAALVVRLGQTAFLLLEVLVVLSFGYSWLVRGSVEPAAAGRAVAGVSVPLAAIVVLYTAHHVTALAGPATPWARWVSLVLGAGGVAAALLALRHKLPGFRLRLTELHDP